MVQKWYLDTAIWRDYGENRSDRFRPLGEWALKFLKKVLEDRDYILYSDLVIEELKVKYTEDEIRNLFEIVSSRRLLVKVEISDAQIKEATMLCRKRSVAFGDALHAVLARDRQAILISRDKHFAELMDIVMVMECAVNK